MIVILQSLEALVDDTLQARSTLIKLHEEFEIFIYCVAFCFVRQERMTVFLRKRPEDTVDHALSVSTRDELLF